MSHPPIHARVLAELRRAFGEPGASSGNGRVWTLRTAPSLAPVCVLLNGTSDHATVWVMDPTDAIGGVLGEVIAHEESIPGLLQLIRERLALHFPLDPDAQGAESPPALPLSPYHPSLP
jgi:hypothetical protein